MSDKGFQFRGDATTAVQKAKFKAGSADKPKPAKLQMKARGAAVPDLDPPVAVPLAVQIVNDTNSVCHGASFSGVVKNELGRVIGKGG